MELSQTIPQQLAVVDVLILLLDLKMLLQEGDEAVRRSSNYRHQHIPDCGHLDHDAWHNSEAVVALLDQDDLQVMLEDNGNRVPQCEV